MTRREEVEDCIINTLFECTHSGEDDTISDKEFAAVLADKFINHETNVLKEFVGWYKERLEHIQAQEQELLEEAMKPTYQKLFASHVIEYRKGTTDMLDRLISWLDNDLKRFVEMSEDDN